MNNVGFCVFGRPVERDYVANGLFEDLKFGEQAYLSLPGNGELKHGDSIAVLSREIKNNTEVIKLFLFEQANSFNERPGGFVGSGIAFSGLPTLKLLHSALVSLHNKAINLIDENRKFKSKTFDKNSIQLINPRTEGLIQGDLNQRNTEIDKRSFYGVKTDGPLINHISSIIQGFLLNPNFKNISTLYISHNHQLLADCLGESKVLSIGHILDYSKFHKSQIEKLSNQQKLIKLNEEKLAKFESEYNTNKSNKEKYLRDLSENESQLKRRIIDLNENGREINSKLTENEHILKQKQKDSRALSAEIEQKNQELRKISSKIQEIRIHKFQELLKHKDFQNEKFEYEQQFRNKEEQLNHKIDKLEQQLEEERERPFITKQVLIVLGSIALLFFIGGGYLGYKWNHSGNKIAESSGQIDADSEVKTAVAKIEKSKINSPDEITAAKFLALTLDEQASHKNALDAFLSEIEKADTSKIDLTNLYERKWNFAEIIDYNKEAIDAGLTRLKRIKSIYGNLGQPTSFFTDQFIINSNGNLRSETLNFNSTKRNEILKKYLLESGNIYKDLNLQIEGIQDFEKDLPILYMHFRWVVYNLSEYKEGNSPKEADILKTNKTKHIVPLKN